MSPITALVYTEGDVADEALQAIARVLSERGVRLAGLVQHNRTRPGRTRCDMELEDLASGETIPISQDRGPQARGCILDLSQLIAAMQLVRRSLEDAPDLVILNKFGKSESEGGGLRPIIADAIESGLPLIIAVPWRNIESFRTFAGELAREIVLDRQGGVDWLEQLGLPLPGDNAPGAAGETDRI